jgi:hypothetical protein
MRLRAFRLLDKSHQERYGYIPGSVSITTLVV